MTDYMPLIFLDFDGVLHPGLAGTFIYLPEFEEFLLKHPSVGVVISSTWREQYPLDELKLYFSAGLRPRIVGATPILNDIPPPIGARALEIRRWRESSSHQGLWAALDDDASLYRDGCPRLVLCNPARGLRPGQLAELEVLLELKNNH